MECIYMPYNINYIYSSLSISFNANMYGKTLDCSNTQCCLNETLVTEPCSICDRKKCTMHCHHAIRMYTKFPQRIDIVFVYNMIREVHRSTLWVGSIMYLPQRHILDKVHFYIPDVFMPKGAPFSLHVYIKQILKAGHFFSMCLAQSLWLNRDAALVGPTYTGNI